jgi:hypothetical protein
MFTHEFDATTGIYMAYALLEKADAEQKEAEENDRMAALQKGTGLGNLYEVKALQARNRAKLLRDAGTAIKTDIHNALVADFGRALDKAEG